MNNDCKTPYQAETGNDKLEVTNKYPFPIIPRGYGAGQTDNVCYQCSNGYDIATARLAVDITSKCLTSLSINAKHEGVTNLDYDYNSNYQSSSSLTRSVFRNTEKIAQSSTANSSNKDAGILSHRMLMFNSNKQ